MAKVAPDNDAVRRFLVRVYAYDPSRRERRHVIVAAYDTETEFREHIARQTRELRRRRDSGQPVDPREHVSGSCLEPGEARRQAAAHVVKSAIRHGVVPPDALIDDARGAAGFRVVTSRAARPDVAAD